MQNMQLLPFDSFDNYIYISDLGEGTYGTVKKYIDKRNGGAVAIKKINDRQSFLREVFMYEKIKKDGVPYFTECKAILPEALVFKAYEFSAEGRRFPMNHPGARPRVMAHIKSLLSALDYLHSHGICHRDIKPSNILFGTDSCVLSDLGSCFYVQNFLTNEIVTTYNFMAPELLFEAPYSFESDIWSLGATLCDLILGDFPTLHMTFKNGKPGDTGKVVRESRIHEELKKIDDEKLCLVLEYMIKENPKDRITARGALHLLFGTKLEYPECISWSGYDESDMKGYAVVSRNSRISKQMRLCKNNFTLEKYFAEIKKMVRDREVSIRAVAASVCLFSRQQMDSEIEEACFFACLWMCSNFYDSEAVTIMELKYHTKNFSFEKVWRFIQVVRTDFFDLTDPLEALYIFMREQEKFASGQQTMEFVRRMIFDDKMVGKSSIEMARQFLASK